MHKEKFEQLTAQARCPGNPITHQCDICERQVDDPHWVLTPWKLGTHLEKIKIECLRCEQVVYIPLKRKRSKTRSNHYKTIKKTKII